MQLASMHVRVRVDATHTTMAGSGGLAQQVAEKLADLIQVRANN